EGWVRAHHLVGFSRQLAKTLLAEVRFDLHRSPDELRDNACGFAGAKVWTRDNERGAKESLNPYGRFRRLAATEFGDSGLGGSGKVTDGVAFAFAVTNQY